LAPDAAGDYTRDIETLNSRWRARTLKGGTAKVGPNMILGVIPALGVVVGIII